MHLDPALRAQVVSARARNVIEELAKLPLQPHEATRLGRLLDALAASADRLTSDGDGRHGTTPQPERVSGGSVISLAAYRRQV